MILIVRIGRFKSDPRVREIFRQLPLVISPRARDVTFVSGELAKEIGHPGGCVLASSVEAAQEFRDAAEVAPRMISDVEHEAEGKNTSA